MKNKLENAYTIAMKRKKIEAAIEKMQELMCNYEDELFGDVNKMGEEELAVFKAINVAINKLKVEDVLEHVEDHDVEIARYTIRYED